MAVRVVNFQTEDKKSQWYTRGRHFWPKTNVFTIRPSVSAAEFKGWIWPNVKLQIFFLNGLLIYSEKAKKIYEILPSLLTNVNTVKNKGKISQNFVAFSEYMNFTNTVKYTTPFVNWWTKFFNLVFLIFFHLLQFPQPTFIHNNSSWTTRNVSWRA